MLRFYVVAIDIEGKDFYLESEQVGLLDPSTHKTIREPQGFFTPDLDKAIKFKSKFLAQATSASYTGSHLVSVHEVGLLK